MEFLASSMIKNQAYNGGKGGIPASSMEDFGRHSAEMLMLF